jgi:hypothetical protein
MPTGPTKGRIAVRVLQIDLSARVEKKLDRILGGEGSRTMQSRFSSRTDIAHECSRLD